MCNHKVENELRGGFRTDASERPSSSVIENNSGTLLAGQVEVFLFVDSHPDVTELPVIILKHVLINGTNVVGDVIAVSETHSNSSLGSDVFSVAVDVDDAKKRVKLIMLQNFQPFESLALFKTTFE